MCHEGWTHYLASLVSYVDTGEGQPSRHERLTVATQVAPCRASHENGA